MQFGKGIRQWSICLFFMLLFGAFGDSAPDKREQIVRITIEHVDVPTGSKNGSYGNKSNRNEPTQTLLLTADDSVLERGNDENGDEVGKKTGKEEKKKRIKDNIIKKLTKILEKVKEIKDKDLLPHEKKDRPEIIPPAKWRHLHRQRAGEKRHHFDQSNDWKNFIETYKNDFFDQSQGMEAGDNVVDVERVEENSSKPKENYEETLMLPHHEPKIKQNESRQSESRTATYRESMEVQHYGDKVLDTDLKSMVGDNVKSQTSDIKNLQSLPEVNSTLKNISSYIRNDEHHKNSTKIESHTTYEGGIFHVKWKDISATVNNHDKKSSSKDSDSGIVVRPPSQQKEILQKNNESHPDHVLIGEGEEGKNMTLADNITNRSENKTTSTRHDLIGKNSTENKIPVKDFTSQTVTVSERKNFDNLDHQRVSQTGDIGDKNPGNGMPSIDSENKHYWDNTRNTKVNINNVNRNWHALKNFSVNFYYKTLTFDGEDPNEEQYTEKIGDKTNSLHGIGVNVEDKINSVHDGDNTNINEASKVNNINDGDKVDSLQATINKTVLDNVNSFHDVGNLKNEDAGDKSSNTDFVDKLKGFLTGGKINNEYEEDKINKAYFEEKINLLGKSASEVEKEIQKLDDEDLAEFKHKILNATGIDTSNPQDPRLTFSFNDEGKTKVDISSPTSKPHNFLEKLQTQLKFLKRHLMKNEKPIKHYTNHIHKLKNNNPTTQNNKFHQNIRQRMKNNTANTTDVRDICTDSHTSSHSNGEDCTRYWLCTGGKRYDVRCPVGLVYNSAISSCDDPTTLKWVSKSCHEKAVRPMSLKDINKRNRYNQYISLNRL